LDGNVVHTNVRQTRGGAIPAINPPGCATGRLLVGQLIGSFAFIESVTWFACVQRIIDVKTFLRFFILVTFFTFFNVFYFPNVFLFLKKRWQSSERQVD